MVGELFSVSLSNDKFSRLGLDERQEVANRFSKTLTRRILSSSTDKLGPIAQLREVAELEFGREFVEESPEREQGQGKSRSNVRQKWRLLCYRCSAQLPVVRRRRGP